MGYSAFGRSLLLTLLAVSAVFCAYFAFDTLGDSHGWRAGLGAAAALLGAALALMLGYYCYNYDRYLDGGKLCLATTLRWGVGCVGCVRGCLRLFLCLRLCCGACSRYDLLLYTFVLEPIKVSYMFPSISYTPSLFLAYMWRLINTSTCSSSSGV